ncbi:PREDICTED: polyhomeotic-like protein 1 isoform X1 [Cyprinodon variegatus]|uniref:polyhomeotic-like protein 1 isoform X1 n=1 Tax=Cyprinodon variegatus TaxID=28743 RepID=UPI000742B6E4|nr:PREDICTED: polyhomeotic-like protein 1 isoform X1 [Cyprinodon variegatus]XP_015237011.1 PREDICTED: polyhomeotic-like protein 1 isoform X1 [Cyprinodon variegatus]
MEADGEQNQQGGSANGSTPSGTSSRPSPMNSMSAYERQAVQALQALQRQPNAAQYFQQLMLQQQINSAQLQNLAAVQQVKATLAASRQSSPSSSSSQTTSTTVASVTSGAGSTTGSRPIGASATSTISQSVLLSGAAGGQGQMYLRVNRSLRTPMPPQLIFMPGSTATAAVATVAQQPQSQQQQEVTPASSSGSQSDNDQAQNLAIRGVSSPKGVKTEAPERSDSGAYSLVQPSHPSNPQSPTKPSPQTPHIKIPTYPQPTNLKAHPTSSSGASSSSSSSTSSIPLSQLLLHGTRTLTTGTTAPTAAHALVLTSNATSQAHAYPVGTATIKPAVNAQTLVVQPLQKAALNTEKSGHANGPIPIQPKTLQSLRLPLQLSSRNPPPILPAPPPASSSNHPSQPPHIPVQIVGARQSSLGAPQALALARGSCNQEGAVLSSSSSLLTMVASIASREGGVVDRGVGLKTLQTPQEGPPTAQAPQVQPQTNQSSAVNQNGASAPSPASSQSSAITAPPTSQSRSTQSLPQGAEEQRRAGLTANGDSSGGQTPQGKQTSVSLKRKSDSASANDEDGPSPPRLQPVRDHSSTPPGNPVNAGSPPPPSSTATPILSVSRGPCGQGERVSPPQAVVKPQVLTHLIEGFVIQEGAEPFPICGPAKDSAGEDLTDDSPDTNQSETVTTATVLKCEYCKNFAPASQFRGTKRFCSMSCAKSMYWFPRYNVSFRQNFTVRNSHSQLQDQDRAMDQDQDQDQGQGHLSNSDEEGGIARRRVPRRTSSEIASAKIAGRPVPAKSRSESSHSEEESSGQEDEEDAMSLSPASSASCHQPPPPPAAESAAPPCLPASPAHWTVEEVSQFISSLQGCEEIASQFLSQEIDGQALLLLKEEHLMSTMNIKLGPALKICAHINTLRD